MTSGYAHPRPEHQMTTYSPEVKRDLSADELQAVFAQTTESVFNDRDVVRHPLTGRITRSPDGADDQLSVEFTTEPVFSKIETYLAGTPTYVDMDFITLWAPGERNNTLIHTQVTDYYQWRFPNEYRAFKDGQAALVTGTPLSLWTYLSPSQVKGLEHAGIRTVEQLANLSDSAGQQFHGYFALKGKAQQFLEATKSTTKASELQDELQKRDAQLSAMQEQLNKLMGALEAQATDKKSRAASKDATA